MGDFMHQLLNSPFSELTKSLIQRLHTDNSNEMELMLKSRSQKASGLEDRGYYQLDIPNGRKDLRLPRTTLLK